MSATAETRVRVPFLDLAPSHGPLRDDLLTAVGEVLDTGAFTNGRDVAAFERSFASFCRARFCVGVSSGLDGLRLGLLALGVGPGDEVVVPALTFVATLEAVTQTGAVPVVADISTADHCLDPGAAAAAIGPRTRAVVAVHLYGQLADVTALARLTADGVHLVEDACQAHGAERDALRAGTAGSVAAFSFYPAKNLGALGDAGAVVTNDHAVAHSATVLREHGQEGKYDHRREGWTARLDTIHAAVLLRKLALLEAWNDERRSAAAYYSEALAGLGDLVLPPVAPGSRPVWHLYVIRTAEPGKLAEFLAQRAISTGRHYPHPVHLTPAYARLGHREGAFPVAEALARECLSLPIFPGIAEAQLAAVCSAIREYFDG